MGVWGTRLYSGDFAMDLGGTISAVAHLTFDSDKVASLCETDSAAATGTIQTTLLLAGSNGLNVGPAVPAVLMLRLSRKAGQETGFAGEDARSTRLQIRH